MQAVQCKMSWYEGINNISICHGSDFLKYAELRTKTILQSISKIVNLTKCKQNCEIYKYDIAKEMPWYVDVGSTSKNQ